MKNVESEVRQIHPEVLKECPYETIIALLEVAKDLRSGKIRRELFNMSSFDSHTSCGTSHCIAGWVAVYLGKKYYDDVKWVNSNHYLCWPGEDFSGKQYELFMTINPYQTPEEAADAIENYIFNAAVLPWSR